MEMLPVLNIIAMNEQYGSEVIRTFPSSDARGTPILVSTTCLFPGNKSSNQED